MNDKEKLLELLADFGLTNVRNNENEVSISSELEYSIIDITSNEMFTNIIFEFHEDGSFHRMALDDTLVLDLI